MKRKFILPLALLFLGGCARLPIQHDTVYVRSLWVDQRACTWSVIVENEYGSVYTLNHAGEGDDSSGCGAPPVWVGMHATLYWVSNAAGTWIERVQRID